MSKHKSTPRKILQRSIKKEGPTSFQGDQTVTIVDEIRTASPERLSEIAAEHVMDWTHAPDTHVWIDANGYGRDFFPHEDRNDLHLVLEKVPEDKRTKVAQVVECAMWNLCNNDPHQDAEEWEYARILFAPPEVILRAALEVILG